MNIMKKFLHIGISLASLTGFFTGWAYLAQASRQNVGLSAKGVANLTNVSFAPIQSVDHLLQSKSASASDVQLYKINPATPIPQPTLAPAPAPQQQLFFPPLKTSGS